MQQLKHSAAAAAAAHLHSGHHASAAQVRVRRQPSRIPALSGIPDPELPPYALLSTPVYSLVSTGSSSRSSGTAPGQQQQQQEYSTTTMNMITYASPIALRPKRKYALGLYVQSLTYQNVKETGRAVLQILQEQHAELFQLLGKTSGRDVDKIAELKKVGVNLQQEYGLPVLADAAGLMELQVVSDFIPAGDHEVVICDVVSWKMMSQQQDAAAAAKQQPLYTGFLRQQGYL